MFMYKYIVNRESNAKLVAYQLIVYIPVQYGNVKIEVERKTFSNKILVSTK